jgi:hypothetical protein
MRERKRRCLLFGLPLFLVPPVGAQEAAWEKIRIVPVEPEGKK